MLVLLVIVLTTATFISTGQIPVDLAKATEAA
ncbi:MAG TPA: biopolymer transporter ExbD, partial [Nitrospiraceae bacterium]